MNSSYRNMLDPQQCQRCMIKDRCFLRKAPLEKYSEKTQNFILGIPGKAYNYREQEKKWHVDYKLIQEELIRYYDSNAYGLIGNELYGLTSEAQKESDRKRIREELKNLLDIAAKITEDENPELSIMFDGIGLILASSYLEAVNKVFSMFKTAAKQNEAFSKKCFGYT